MNQNTLKRLLRKAIPHCPPKLAKQIEEAVGPQPEETLSRQTLIECLIESIDARDIDDALHYSLRISNLDATPE